MITLIFSKEDHSDIVMTENDLFDWSYEHSCFSGDTFELGGVNAKSLYLLIDNSEHRFTRGNLSHTRIELLIDGYFMGYFNTSITKHRNGTIELYAYDDMLKLDTEFPDTHQFPSTFNSVYAECIYTAGLAEDRSFDHIVNNGCFDSGAISHEYTDYIYANSCRQLVGGMAEWNGGFCFINDDGKLQVQPFSKEVSAEFSSGELMEFDYSDETLVFTKVKSSFKTKTYELGTDDGYTLVINNQYIQYGISDYGFEVMLGKIHEYYNGFTLTPMSFTLATPNLSLRIGDRISVCDEEEGVTVVGNISKIQITGNLLMQVTCGGFSTETINNCGSTSASQTNQSKTNASASAKKLQTTDAAIAVTTSSRGMEIYNADRQYIGILSLSDQKFDLSSGSSTISMDGNNNYFQLYGGSLKVILESLGLSVTSGNMTFEALSGLGGRYRITDSGITFEWANGTKLELYSDPSSGGISISWVSGAKMRFSADPNGGGELSCSWRGGGSLEYSEATGTLKVNGKRVLTEE